MTFEHRKTITFWLAQAARAHRVSFGAELSNLDLHVGQEIVLKVLSEKDGQTMGMLASELGVQPPTVTKTVTRLANQGFLERRASSQDARQSYVHITEKGRLLIRQIDKKWKQLERRALAGIEDKDRRLLRKLLKRVEKNIGRSTLIEDEDDIEELDNQPLIGILGSNDTSTAL
ncbi:MAG: MarR family transcriptional regulator [Rhizobiales bacterium]|nr:MarR family transcriptional regulator [Hyphomicrobiales bacterium]